MHAIVENKPAELPPDHSPMVSRAQDASLKDDPLVSRGEAAAARAGNLEEKHASVGKDVASVVKASLGSIAESAARLASGKIPPISAARRRELAARQVMIDVMILYTPKVARKYVDLETDLIALSIEQANESFASSGLGHIKLNLVHQEVKYEEGNSQP